MRGSARQAEPAGGDLIRPAALKVAFDPAICAGKLACLVRDAEDSGGLQRLVGALEKKHALFAVALEIDALDRMGAEALEALLECVFPARRRLPVAGGHEQALAEIRDLLYGEVALGARMEGFADALGGNNAKLRRAAWDFGAELLHFGQPERYPLMTRWVWDARAGSGALREFIRGGDALREIALEATPEAFEGARLALTEQLAVQGFYRDVPYLIDLLLAQAYADYLRAMSSGLGLLRADFGAQHDPVDLVVKLLGIDSPRRSGRSRVANSLPT
jgi:hypothetical protein